MIGLLALIFIGTAWAQCNPLDPSCQASADAKRNSWKQKVVYCDSTVEPIQHCKDLTPCSPQYLDCTKGPNRCICEIVNPVAGGAADQGLNVNPNAQGLGFITNRAFQGTQGNVPNFRRQEQTSQQIISGGQQAPQVYGQDLAVRQRQGITQSSQGWVGQQQGVAQGFAQGQSSFQGQGNLQGQGVLGGQQDFIGYQPSNSNDHGAQSIAEFVRGNPMLTTFAFLLNDPRYSDVVQLLSGTGPVTVFIPTNEGFAKSGIDATNVPLVRDMLKHHIVPNMAVNSADFVPFQKLFTAEGDKLKITKVNSGWMVNDAKIVIPDVQAKNGIIFIIDRALVPPTQKTQLQNLGTASRGFQVSSPNQGGLQSQEFRGVGQNQISSPRWNQGTFQDANRGFQGPRVSESSGVQGQWHGSGLYCVAQTELYYCDDKQECLLQESCKLGCVHADPGFPDYCFTPDSKTSSRGGFQLPKTPNFQLPNINQPPFQQSQQQDLLVGRWNQ